VEAKDTVITTHPPNLVVEVAGTSLDFAYGSLETPTAERKIKQWIQAIRQEQAEVSFKAGQQDQLAKAECVSPEEAREAIEQAKKEVAKEIFEEIEKISLVRALYQVGESPRLRTIGNYKIAKGVLPYENEPAEQEISGKGTEEV
jgi:hypothetical protein